MAEAGPSSRPSTNQIAPSYAQLIKLPRVLFTIKKFEKDLNRNLISYLATIMNSNHEENEVKLLDMS